MTESVGIKRGKGWLRVLWRSLAVLSVLVGAIRAYPAEVRTTAQQQYGLGWIKRIEYSNDGKWILTSAGSGARIVDATTGEVIRSFRGHTDNVYHGCFSPDNMKVATTSYDGKTLLFDVQSGTLIRTFYRPVEGCDLCFSVDGNLVVAYRDGVTVLWNTETGGEMRRFIAADQTGGSQWDIYIAVSPDGSQLIQVGLTTYIWNIETGAVIRTLPINITQSYCVTYSPDSAYIALGGNTGNSTLWDSATGENIRTFYGDSEVVMGVDFSPDGQYLATAGYDMKVTLWRVSSGQRLLEFQDDDWLHDVRFSPDGKNLACGGLQCILRVLNSEDLSEKASFYNHTGFVNAVAISPDGSKVLTGGTDNVARTWDFDTGELLQRFVGHVKIQRTASQINAVAFSSDGTRVLTGAADYTARLWDTETGEQIRVFSGHSDQLETAVFSPEMSTIATGAYYNRDVLIWDTNTGAHIRTIPSANGSGVRALAYSPDGTEIASVGWDTTPKLWNADSCALIRQYSGHTEPLHEVSFSPDGEKLITCGRDGTARIWNTDTGQQLQVLNHGGWVWTCRFSPDGALVVTGGDDGKGKLWDAESGELLQELLGHARDVHDAAFSPDGRYIITGSLDGTALRWEIEHPRAVVVVGGGDFPGNSIGEQTQDLGAYAFKTLKARGYEPNDILYLTAFGPEDPENPSLPFQDADEDGLNDVDGWATLSSLREAIIGSFGRQSNRLLILMMDHGYRTGDFTGFRLNETQILPTEQMKTWLDDLQNSNPVDVTLVVDSCYSGEFVEDCRTAPVGRKRIVVSSTSREAEAVFLPPPDLTSFMFTFLGSAYMGNSIGEAWRAGQRFFESFPIAEQAPQIVDDSTGTLQADKEYFGASWTYGVQSTEDINRYFPAFESVMADMVIGATEPVRLWVRVLPNLSPSEVVAVLRPPAPDVVSGEPIMDLPHVQLIQSATDSALWEAIDTSTFSERGAYVVSFTARFAYERLSNPSFCRITVSEGVDPDATPIHAILAIGETDDSDLNASFDELGPYAFNVYYDRFQDNSGQRHPDWIDYFIDPSVDLRSDGIVSSTAILNAIDSIPEEVGRLYVHLVADSLTPGELSMTAGDSIGAASLDQALDNLQARQTCTVVLVIDSPNSGAFLNPCRATGTQERVVMTSGRETDTGLFLSEPLPVSFSYKYLSAGYMGSDLKNCFRSARNFYSTFLRDSIKPLMDDNGDGLSSKLDGPLAQSLHLGRRFAFAGSEASELPFILDVTPEEFRVSTEESVQIVAQLMEGVTPTRVFLQRLPFSDGFAESPISSLQEVELTRESIESWIWSVDLALQSPAKSEILAVYASYPDSVTSDKISQPMYVTIIGDGGDDYEPDDTPEQANLIMVNATENQSHNFFSQGDEDWVKFYVYFDNYPYSIRISNPGSNCDAAFSLYSADDLTTPVLGPVDEEGFGGSEMKTWLSTAPGWYYIRAQSAVVDATGPETHYELSLTGDTGANNGLATATSNGSVQLTWGGVTGTTIHGYHVYRSMSLDMDAFERISVSLIGSDAFEDFGVQAGNGYYYLVYAETDSGLVLVAGPLFADISPSGIKGWEGYQ